MEEKDTLKTKLKEIDKRNGNGEYHDILWYAVQSLKENALQSTWRPEDSIEGCGQGESCGGGCAGCTLKCSRASQDIPGDDPFAERNPTGMAEPPLPETTFPFLQIAASLAACVAGCYFAQNFVMQLLGK